MSVPSSSLFEQMSWDKTDLAFPTLDCIWKIDNQQTVEVTLIGAEMMSASDWDAFVRSAETTAQSIYSFRETILTQASSRIATLYRAYFPDRTIANPPRFHKHLTPWMLCFYSDPNTPDFAHFWFNGSDEFNCLDIDITLDPELRVVNVRFDG